MRDNIFRYFTLLFLVLYSIRQTFFDYRFLWKVLTCKIYKSFVQNGILIFAIIFQGIIFNQFVFSQTLIWYENFNNSAAPVLPGSITSTSCTQTTVGTWQQTDCIPSGWRTGRLELSGSNIGRRGAATTQWDRLNSGGSGNYSLEFERGK